MTTIIAVANEKGGVAKTTTTLALGGVYVQEGKDVLLVDLDAQSNLTLALGIKPDTVRRSVADILLGSASILSISRETSLPGLDLLPANADMGKTEHLLPVRREYEYQLQRAFRSRLYYDYAIIDCPPSLGAVTLNALTAADLLIIPTQAEYFSSHALRKMLRLVNHVRQTTNPNLSYKILITMLDLRNRIHRIIQDQLRNSFPDSLFSNVIQIDTRLRESPVVGLPITYFSKNTRSSQQYQALALEIAQDVQKPVAQPA